MQGEFLLGVDGGGSKAAALLADGQGPMVGRGLAGPSNHHGIGTAAASTALRAALSAALGIGAMTASDLREAKVNRALDDAAIGFAGRALHAPRAIVHADQRPTIQLNGGVTWSRLTAQAEAGVEFLEITYAPGATSATPHRLTNSGDKPMRALWVVFERS